MIRLAFVLVACILAGLLIVPVTSEWDYEQPLEGMILTTYPQSTLIESDLVNLDIVAYPLMVSGTKYTYDDSDGEDEGQYPFTRPYGWSYVNYEIIKNGQIIQKDHLSGFTSAINHNTVKVYDSGKFRLNLSGQYVKVRVINYD